MKRVVSGMRPTGKLHLGHLEAVLKNWVNLQDEYQCFFFVADWHALTSDYADTSQIRANTLAMVCDWLGAGLDPNRSTIFVQSLVPQHAELHLLLSAVTPLGWLERVPTYKEAKEQIKDKDLNNYAFLGYPVLQAADILIYKGECVPVGEDQVPHLELTREIARRFNHFYSPIFPEPEAMLAPDPRVVGTDGRRMSKSYRNDIKITDPPEQIWEKLRTMVTDPARVRRHDPGNPDVCPVFALHHLYSPPETIAHVNIECRRAGIGCIDCKKLLYEPVIQRLEPIAQRSRQYEQNLDAVTQILIEGSRRAREEAEATMRQVREAVRIGV
ncbi:MAG: tryptophan--tRNA ligase [Acidobacteriota bacterium]|nr:tryptophan--tRNA ligase [Blastocatellia bacterium]MDW8239381.1 tryptophan--tRNA ligase [Acidobacteriota bacterium]